MSNFQVERTWWEAKPQTDRLAIAQAIADDMKKIEISDPFIYQRTMSSLLNNVTVPEDYKKRRENELKRGSRS